MQAYILGIFWFNLLHPNVEKWKLYFH